MFDYYIKEKMSDVRKKRRRVSSQWTERREGEGSRQKVLRSQVFFQQRWKDDFRSFLTDEMCAAQGASCAETN